MRRLPPIHRRSPTSVLKTTHNELDQGVTTLSPNQMTELAPPGPSRNPLFISNNEPLASQINQTKHSSIATRRRDPKPKRINFACFLERLKNDVSSGTLRRSGDGIELSDISTPPLHGHGTHFLGQQIRKVSDNSSSTYDPAQIHGKKLPR